MQALPHGGMHVIANYNGAQNTQYQGAGKRGNTVKNERGGYMIPQKEKRRIGQKTTGLGDSRQVTKVLEIISESGWGGSRWAVTK